MEHTGRMKVQGGRKAYLLRIPGDIAFLEENEKRLTSMLMDMETTLSAQYK